MARPKSVSLYGIVATPDGKVDWKQVQFHPKTHQPVSLKNPTDREAFPIKKATSFLIRFSENGKRVTPRFASLDLALVAFRTRQDVENGTADPNTLPVPLASVMGRIPIKHAAKEYLEQIAKDVEAGEKSRKTLQAYRAAVTEFANHTAAEFMDYKGISEAVMVEHLNWLRTTVKRRKRGHLENTVATRFRILKAFFASNGLKLMKSAKDPSNAPGIMSSTKFPKERDVSDEDMLTGTMTYSEDDLKAMLKLASPDEADLVNFALRTGFRAAEIAHAEWGDIDWTGKKRQDRGLPPTPNILCQNKQKSEWLPHNFRTKSGRVRKVEIASLVPRLQARQTRMVNSGEKSTLIFPNDAGKPGEDRLRNQLQELVAKVEAGDKQKKAKPHKIEGEIGLHRFRKTFATTMLAACGGDIRTVGMLLGHRKIETTMRYLGVDRTKAAQAARGAFTQFGD